MFLNSDENTAAIEALLANSDSIQCAVAFLGSKAFDVLSVLESKVQVLCNLESGGTNPFAVEKLMKLENVEVKNHPLLHAKVYLGDAEAIVSSANLSANGLGLEDNEVASWLEAGYRVQDPVQLSKMKAWFSERWDALEEISNKDIKQAKKKWKKRRTVRENPPKTKSILKELENYPDFFKDKNVFFTIYRDDFSEEGESLLEELKMTDRHGKKLDAYEDWEELGGNSYYIALQYKKNEDFEFHGISYSGEKTIINRDGVSLFLCHKVESINGLKITSSDKELLRKKIKSLNGSNEHAKKITMKAARKYLFGK